MAIQDSDGDIPPINWDIIHSTNYDGTCTYCGHDCTDLASKAERRKALDLLDKLALHGNPYESSPENKENFHFTK